MANLPGGKAKKMFSKARLAKCGALLTRAAWLGGLLFTVALPFLIQHKSNLK